MKAEDAQSRPIDTENDLPNKLLSGGICEWLRVDGKRFTEPFFSETIHRCNSAQARNVKHRPGGLDEMLRLSRLLPPIKPATFIFHISRCGSTLVTQAFATCGRFISLSEVPFFDDIIRSPLQDADFGMRYGAPELFEAALRFYGRKRHPAEESVLVKTDCWHIFFYDVFRNLFPDVPFVLMYRNPAEVLRSLVIRPALHTSPHLVQPEIFGLPGMPEIYQVASYAAVILEKLLQKFLAVASMDKRSLLINYNEGTIPVIKKIAAFANLEITAGELVAMEERSLCHSKYPGVPFYEGPVNETPSCLDKAMAVYKILEEKRTGYNKDPF